MTDAQCWKRGLRLEAGESGRHRLERLHAREADCEAELARIRRNIAAIESGIAGEEKIACLLSELGRPEWWVLHDRRKSPRSPANIDHIVIGPTGVHVLDAKNWSGKLWIGDKGVICGRIPRADDEHALIELRDLIHHELSTWGFAVPVYGVVALANDETATEIFTHNGIAYVPPTQLIRGITGRDEVLTPELCYRLWELVDDLHPPRISSGTSTRGLSRRPHRRGPATALPTATPPRAGGRLRRRPQIVAALVAGIVALGLVEEGVKHLSKSVNDLTSVTQPKQATTTAAVPSRSATPTPARANAHKNRRQAQETAKSR